MVPRKFIFVHDLPSLPSGKLDHQALLVLARSRSSSGASFASPQTDMEKTIANIWQMALQADGIGLDDNFLEIGGHSLLMVEVAAKLQKELQLEVMVTELFEYPTVRALARHLSGGKESAAAAANEVQERAFKQKQAQQARDLARQQQI
jgi:acyl carrier protein